MIKNKFDLIITIVEKGNAEDVIESAKRAGAEGGTILSGRGSGIHDTTKILGILIEPEKEIVLTLIDKKKTEDIMMAIKEDLQLEKEGRGISFAIEAPYVTGICHKE